ncbi:hypothetical protein C8J57DRAFT_1519499 [Mycena rebaudengoi]|nr:hypothetical protein C8J57DRAFT_1519499 [Mycena rebaudengoi]
MARYSNSDAFKYGAMRAPAAAGPSEASSPATRRYAHPRRPCSYGYSRWPALRSFMTFDLRWPCVQTRIVQNEHETVEIWSPNCRRVVFVAGLRDPAFSLTTPSNLTDRRYDAHLGRFDYSCSAQYWDRDSPWWPYMRRVRSILDHDRLVPAFKALTTVWGDWPGSGSRGYLDPSFVNQLVDLTGFLDQRMGELRPSDSNSSLWTQHPQFPSPSEVRMLLEVSSWDEAVDLGVAIQRGVHEKDAWVSMREAIKALAPISDEKLQSYRFPPANDSFIGVVVNGMSEQNVLRHMAAGVPCFVVHRFAPGAVPQSAMGLAPARGDFLQGTELERLLSDTGNPYQRAARAQCVQDSVGSASEGLGHTERGSLEDERRSSSAYQLQLDMAAKPPVEESRRSRSPTPEILVKGDPFPPPPLVKEMIDIGRVDWIVPPAILDVNKKGSWEKWELGLVNGEPAYVFQGKKQQAEARYEMFDRRLKRRLLFDDLPDLEGMCADARFGIPVHRVPFYFPSNKKDLGDIYLAKQGSDWMYPSMEPARGDVGRYAPRPSAHSLPRLGGDRRPPLPSSPFPRPSYSSPLESSGHDEDSRIVVVTNLAPEVSATFFARLASIDLQDAGAKLLEVGNLALLHLPQMSHGTRFGENIITTLGTVLGFCDAAMDNSDCCRESQGNDPTVLVRSSFVRLLLAGLQGAPLLLPPSLPPLPITSPPPPFAIAAAPLLLAKGPFCLVTVSFSFTAAPLSLTTPVHLPFPELLHPLTASTFPIISMPTPHIWKSFSVAAREEGALGEALFGSKERNHTRAFLQQGAAVEGGAMRGEARALSQQQPLASRLTEPPPAAPFPVAPTTPRGDLESRLTSSAPPRPLSERLQPQQSPPVQLLIPLHLRLAAPAPLEERMNPASGQDVKGSGSKGKGKKTKRGLRSGACEQLKRSLRGAATVGGSEPVEGELDDEGNTSMLVDEESGGQTWQYGEDEEMPMANPLR